MKSLLLLLLLPTFAFAQQVNVDSLLLVYQSEGDTLLAQGAYNEALSSFSLARDVQEKRDSTATESFTSILSNIGYCYSNLGNYDKAIDLYSQNKAIVRQLVGEEHADYALVLNDLGTMYYYKGDLSKSLSFYRQAEAIQAKVLEPNNRAYASTLNNIAMLHSDMGNLELALPLFLQVKEIESQTLGEEDPNYAITLNGLGNLYHRMGNYTKALELLMQARAIDEKALGKDHPDYSYILNDLGFLHLQMGNYELALPLYEQAKQICLNTVGKKHYTYILTLVNIGRVYLKMQRYTKSLSFYKEALSIASTHLSEEDLLFNEILNDYAVLEVKRKAYSQAINLYKRILAIDKQTRGTKNLAYTVTLNNLADVYRMTKSYDLAEPLYQRALTFEEANLGKEHPNVISTLNNLVKLKLEQGDYQQVGLHIKDLLQRFTGKDGSLRITKAFKQALLNANYTSQKKVQEATRTLRYLSLLAERDSRMNYSLEDYLAMDDLIRDLLAKQRGSLSNMKDQLRLLSKNSYWLQRSIAKLSPQKHRHRAFQLSEQNKAILLLEATQSEQAYSLGKLPDTLVWKKKKLLKTQVELQAKLYEKGDNNERDSLRNELNKVNESLQALTVEIKTTHPKYHQLSHQQIDTKVEEIQELLNKETALVEYLISDSTVHLFLVDKQGISWKQIPLSSKELNKKIKRYHKVLSDYTTIVQDPDRAYLDYTSQAYWFYQQLLQPILTERRGIKELIIVTDGALGHLPFETFLVEAAEENNRSYKGLHYLLKDYNISYNYSAGLWKELQERQALKNNGQLFGIAANYTLNVDTSEALTRSSSDQFLRRGLQPLPAARKEVEHLSQQYKGFFAFDEKASEKTVKQLASSYSILHFATHGILNAKHPMLSSLALSEDNNKEESNFLQAHEIAQMQLHADLVVLSACETGYGKFEKGNGIASLARSFMYAGAQALIVSLWQVNDDATSRLMVNLYQNIAQGMSKDQALNLAKQQYIQSASGLSAHPAFWSPFILMGNTKAIPLREKGGGINIFLWSVVGGIVLLGVKIFRKKIKK